MARKPTQKDSEIRIREKDEEEYFRKGSSDPLLPPELNMTVRDGFRFGIGFLLAMAIFWIIVVVGVFILVRIGHVVHLG